MNICLTRVTSENLTGLARARCRFGKMILEVEVRQKVCKHVPMRPGYEGTQEEWDAKYQLKDAYYWRDATYEDLAGVRIKIEPV